MRPRLWRTALVNLLAWSIVLAVAFPLIWMVLTSIKPQTELFRIPPSILPQSVTFERFSGYEVGSKLLETNGGYERVTIVTADRDFFPVLGVAPSGPHSSRETRRRSQSSAPDSGNASLPGSSAIGRTLALTGSRWDPVQRRSSSCAANTPSSASCQRPSISYSASSTFAGFAGDAHNLWIPTNV
jgi:hypothetical protein